MQPGVGYLASVCPGVPVIPLSTVGVQGLWLRDVLLLRRPQISLLVGEPFVASSLAEEPERQAAAVVERIDREWKRLEESVVVEAGARLPEPAVSRWAASPTSADDELAKIETVGDAVDVIAKKKGAA